MTSMLLFKQGLCLVYMHRPGWPDQQSNSSNSGIDHTIPMAASSHAQPQTAASQRRTAADSYTKLL